MNPDVAHSLASQVLAWAHAIHIRPGERLPGERRIAQQLGRSRNTVRELLVYMANKGLVDISPRSGTYLRADFQEENNIQTLYEALEALLGLAPQLVRACVSSDIRCMPCLESITTQLGQSLINARPDQVWVALLDCYRQMARGSNKPLFEALLEHIYSCVPCIPQEAIPAHIFDSGGLQPFFNAHVEMLRAMRNLDATRAEASASASLHAFANTLDHKYIS